MRTCSRGGRPPPGSARGTGRWCRGASDAEKRRVAERAAPSQILLHARPLGVRTPASRPSAREVVVSYAVIGFGSIGQALARAVARKSIEVKVASRRPTEALEAEIVFLTVPFAQHAEVAAARPNWRDRLIVDLTNAFGVPVEELDGLPSSAAVARGLSGARLVKLQPSRRQGAGRRSGGERRQARGVRVGRRRGCSRPGQGARRAARLRARLARRPRRGLIAGPGGGRSWRR